MDSPPSPLRFYRASDRPFGAFSNLYRRSVVFEGCEFPTAEHAYQAGKARKPEVRAWLMAAPSPSLLAMAAHGLYHWDIAPGWSRNRFERMQRVVLAKFEQHQDLEDLLLSTDDQELIETASVNNDVNRRWGQVLVDGEYVGQNWLGKILMETRGILRDRRRLFFSAAHG